MPSDKGCSVSITYSVPGISVVMPVRDLMIMAAFMMRSLSIRSRSKPILNVASSYFSDVKLLAICMSSCL